MSVIYDGSVSLATVAGPRRWFIPFNDGRKLYFEQDYQQLWSTWQPLALDTVYVPTTSGGAPDLNDQYHLVHESDPQDLSGGICQWTRRYASIPASRIEFESYAHSFPGLETGSLGPLKYISTAASAAGVTAITTTTSHSMTTGDQVIIKYTARLPDGTQLGRQVFRTALTGTTGSNLNVSVIIDGSIAAWISAQKADIGREAFTEEVGSWLTYDYFMPGASAGVTTFADIPIINSPIIVDADGTRTDSYTATSAPTKTEYITDVKNKVPYVAHDSILRRWHGNIYERMTRYITPK